ncbi:stage V sporulation protein AC [Anoxybacillus voinovskiensis]|uniref:Stage V sporulation protein AC n=1 Tax=Anoxybacteroides voinovskiense TaxID=230470 RepID=A0A840DUA9_9BACL|nr:MULTISPECIES: SpoVA/SpoVAEb family sporulation membrane protein [Anoxybacillus]MBB4073099.1 stage V sporulation protein AC [Anoxybacillus voinovskiensis]MCZ0754588.1 SpoVA/SpoVAEb family sporulation membrane protein [Anoxybacillus sp. J5B_2022]GGJ59510.1 stage V sporulation protein AC [Anoxybacillus voinovskiensis]
MRLRDNYRQAVKKFQPKPSYVANSLKAFFIGGGLSVVAEVLRAQFRVNLPSLAAEQAVLLLFIGAAVVLTAIGVYDEFSQFAGAGSTMLITWFANSLTSAALEHRSEGVVSGIAGHMFKVGGAALVYGIVAAYLFGLVYFMR